MLLVGTQLSLGQSANIVQAHDSLMKLLPTLKADTTRIDVLKEIGKTWISRDPAKALQYVNESIALARKIKDTHRVKLGLLNLGYQYNVYGESGKAIETLQETCRLAQKDLDSHTAMVAVAFISTAYVKQGDLENALHYAWFLFPKALSRKFGVSGAFYWFNHECWRNLFTQRALRFCVVLYAKKLYHFEKKYPHQSLFYFSHSYANGRNSS